MFRVLLVFAFSISSSAFANDNVTSVFTDSQFTASNYGMRVAQECLNPGNIRDANTVRFFANPAGSTHHLVHNDSLPILGSGQSFVWRFDATAERVHTLDRTARTRPKPYFDSQLNDPEVNRIMIFMGVNEVNDRNTNWIQLAQRIQSSGKQCFVSLPPLVDRDSLNRRIIEYNQYVSGLLARTQCRVVDPSNTLDEDVSQRVSFRTSDGLHFSNSNTQDVAEATCQAITEVVSGDRRPTPAPDALDDDEREEPVSAPVNNRLEFTTDELPFVTQ